MKKVLLIAAILFTAGAVKAQDLTGKTIFSIGTGSAGYQNFGVKVGEDFSFVPVLAGGKFNLGKGLYGHPQVGYSFLTNKIPGSNQNNREFTCAASVGYGFGKDFDAAVKYLSVDAAIAVLLRLAYTF